MSLFLPTPSTRRAGASVALLAAGALALSGCAASSQSATPSTAVVAAYSGTVDSLDPQHSDYGQTNLIDATLYEPLVTYDADNQLVAGLASTFELSADATSVSIVLNDGVTFHDGSPLTSADVKYSLDRYVSVGTGIASLLSNYASTEIVDDTTLTITLKQPDSIFLGKLSKAYILSQKLVEANAGDDQGQGWLSTHDAGTGPFTLPDDVVAGQNITVERYDDYWDYDEARPESITFRRIDESATQRAELEAGNIDYANNLSTADFNAIDAADITKASLDIVNQQFIYFNTTTGPTSDVRVRQALQLAFDYEGALSSILGGQGQIATGPVPLGMPCTLDTPAFAQDLDKAKQLLDDAGQSGLTLTMRYQPDISDQAQEAVLYQSDLQKIGVTLNLEPITFADYLTLLQSTDTIPQMILLADNAQVPNVGSFLTQFYGPDSAGSNRSGFTSPELSALITDAAATSDEAAQCDDYTQAQQIVYDQATAVDLFTIPWPAAYSSRLQNVEASATVTPVSFADVTVD
ncbi:ABC transporter substrate-binding protein [Herbiconiux daphne]|uniref:ABC transporter substrate-binding protein n=1 Tax=Herbiconiux daphne TaxID=2970914 RepID=A0ABT2H6K4_9MICO|nr:ABC transporter substrate-binding protein [Herbiconiux daphne]MCS5735554.1 ABC transporter substrate-binding protein [Herbiconiux daphne]